MGSAVAQIMTITVLQNEVAIRACPAIAVQTLFGCLGHFVTLRPRPCTFTHNVLALCNLPRHHKCVFGAA